MSWDGWNKRNIHSVNIEAAPLPPLFEAAQRSLRECARVDECKDWTREEALAAYQYQAGPGHDLLMKLIYRIGARAIQRGTELWRDLPEPLVQSSALRDFDDLLNSMGIRL